MEPEIAKGPPAARFAESLDLFFGRRQAYFQRPRYYYFPGLPQIQFYERAAFPWLDRIEAATAVIQAEREAEGAAAGNTLVLSSVDEDPATADDDARGANGSSSSGSAPALNGSAQLVQAE